LNVQGTYSDPELITKLTNARMPFGKYSKTYLTELPIAYLTWFCKTGFPGGELGQLMRIVHEIKLGEMEHLFEEIRLQQSSQSLDIVNNK
jgi:uncharacterized protein (DUF3820 family)